MLAPLYSMRRTTFSILAFLNCTLSCIEEKTRKKIPLKSNAAIECRQAYLGLRKLNYWLELPFSGNLYFKAERDSKHH